MSGTSRLRVASWNINGLRARAELLGAWLKAFKPDLLLLQETKIEDRKFPFEFFEEEGYQAVAHGQKSFNGVAILSRHAVEDVSTALPGDSEDGQARWMEAIVTVDQFALRVCSAYVPNGNPIPGPKFGYKLAWMERLRQHAADLLREEMAVAIGGDFNVVPTAMDAADPESLVEDAVFQAESRAAWHQLVHAGWTDSFRLLNPEPGHYSYWDYQAGAWRRNRGIRIDHLLLSPQASDRLRDAGIERDIRGEPKPSDHVPIWCDLSFGSG